MTPTLYSHPIIQAMCKCKKITKKKYLLMIFTSAKVCTHVQIQNLSILFMNNGLNVSIFLTQSHHKASEDLK